MHDLACATPLVDNTPITSFSGRWRGLSNFTASHIVVGGTAYKSVEQAFQAEKTLDPSERHAIMAAHTPSEVKRLGRQVTLRPGWGEVRVDVMRRSLRAKFALPSYRALLLSTGERELIEGNTWHDNDWGDCTCRRCAGIPGQNLLGKLLMEVRDQIRDDLSRDRISTKSAAARSQHERTALRP